MAIFYTDSGSFETLEVTGSTILSGSLIVSGATNFGPSGLTGSLFGTASYADSSSYALTASYAANGASTPAFPFSGSAVITGSLFISQSISGTPALRATGSIDFVTGSSRISTTANTIDLGGSSNANISINSANTSIDFTAGGGNIASINGVGIVPSNIGAWIGDPGDGDNSRWQIYSKAIDNSGTIGSSIITATQFTASNARINGSVSASSYTSSLNNQVGYLGTSSWAVNTSTSSYVSSDLGAGNPTVVNTNAGGGLVLQGTGVGQVAQLRIVPNAGGWVDNINTAYFQVLATTGNYLTVMGGTYAADTVLERLQFNSKFTQLSNGFYNTTPAPSYVFQVLNLTSSVTPVVSILGNSSQTANYLDVTTDGGTTGSIFTIKGTGNVGIGVPAPETKLQVQGNVSASSYTSSLDNQVGFLGTSSFAVSSSRAVTAQNGFPFSGSAVISGSLLVSSSNNNSPVTISGSTDSFFELEVVNFSAGNNASSDIVVSSNNTTDFGNYIDLGINSTTFNGPLVGGASDGYLYFTSSVGELDIGNASPTANGNVRLFAGGPDSTATTRVFISASGNVGIGTTTNLLNRLTVQGSVSASSVTSSFTGSFTGALTHFNPVALKLTVGTTAPTSPAVNDLWVDTN